MISKKYTVAIIIFLCFPYIFSVDNIWIGGSDYNWNTAANWKTNETPPSNHVPTSTENVLIPSGKMPIISSAITCPNKITLESDAILTIKNNMTLTSNVEINGGCLTCLANITANGNIMVENGYDLAGLTITSGKTFTVGTGNVCIKGSLSNSGTIVMAGTGIFYGSGITSNKEIGNVKYAVSSEVIPGKYTNLEVAAGKTLTVKNSDITVTGTFTNNGTIDVAGTGKLSGTGITSATSLGNFDYVYTDGTNNYKNIINGTYSNLTISAGKWQTTDSVTVTNNTIVKNAIFNAEKPFSAENIAVIKDSSSAHADFYSSNNLVVTETMTASGGVYISLLGGSSSYTAQINSINLTGMTQGSFKVGKEGGGGTLKVGSVNIPSGINVLFGESEGNGSNTLTIETIGTGTQTYGSSAIFYDSVVLKGNVSFGKDATFQKTVTAVGDVTFGRNTTFYDNATLDGKMIFKNNVKVAGGKTISVPEDTSTPPAKSIKFDLNSSSYKVDLFTDSTHTSTDHWILDVCPEQISGGKFTISNVDSNYPLAGCFTTPIEGVADSTTNIFDALYFWKGESDNKWETVSNWKTGKNADKTPTVPPSVTDSRTVITVDSFGKYPLEDLPSGDTITLKRLVVKNSYIDLGTKNIKTVKIENNARIKLSGSNTIQKITPASNGSATVASGAITFTQGDNSIVEYTGTSAVPVLGNTYKNLYISAGSFSASDAITVENNIYITGNPTVKFNQKNNGQTTSCKKLLFTYEDDDVSPETTYYNGESKIYFGNHSSDVFSVTDGSIEVNSGSVYLAGNIKSSSNEIYNCPVTVIANTTIDTATAIKFYGNITGNAVNLTIKKPLTFENASQAVNISGLTNLSLEDTVSLASNLNINVSGQVDTKNTVTGTNYDLSVIATNGFTAHGNIVAKNIKIGNNTNSTTFTSKASSIKTAGNQEYYGKVVLEAASVFEVTDTATGSITFNEDISGSYDFTVNTKGAINLNCKSIAVANKKFCGNVNVLSETVTVSGSGNVTFDSFNSVGSLNASNDSNKLIVKAGSGDVAFLSKIGDIKPFNIKIESSGITSVENASSVKDFSVIVSKYFDITETNGTLTVLGSFSCNNDAQIAGLFTSANSASFGKDVYIYGTSNSIAAKLVKSGTGSFSIANNLHIAGDESKNVKLSAPSSVKSIIVYGGKVSLEDNNYYTILEDLVLFGSKYNANDAESNISDLLTYDNPLRKTFSGNRLKNSAELKTMLPSGAGITYNKGSFVSLSEKSFIVSKNFYANGFNLESSEKWYLLFPESEDFFREAHNCSIKNCNSSPWLAAAEGCTDKGDNVQVAFSRPVLLDSGTFTVYDDVIKVEFVDSLSSNSLKIENSHNEISKAVSKITYNNGTEVFAGSYCDADCTQSTDENGDLSVFYLKANANKWNTDATGSSVGHAQSTDRKGVHREILPNITIPKATNDLYETLRDEHKNRIKHYDGTNRYKNTADMTKPVLIAVRTGQEMHTDATTQPHYDAHNFIEFQYSEPVDIGSLLAYAGNVNIPTGSNFFDSGAENSVIVSQNGSGLKITGLATIASGKIDCGKKSSSGSIVLTGVSDVHAFYREFSLTATDTASKQPTRIRLSIAGFIEKSDGVTGGVTVAGKKVPYWPGFINSAACVMPSGTVTRIDNDFIVDKSTLANKLEKESEANLTVNHKLDVLTVRTDGGELYGKWDLSPPSVAAHRENSSLWTSAVTEYEISGSSSDSTKTYLDQIEFHFFDNTPSYSSGDGDIWVTYGGWINSNQNAYDKAGGARPFDSVPSRRTSGGLRLCTLIGVEDTFRYTPVHRSQKQFGSFVSNDVSIESYFGSASGTVSMPSVDTLYFTLGLNNPATPSNDDALSLNLPRSTTFAVDYLSDDTHGFITDLAGNRMLAFSDIKSVDAAPPEFSVTLSPLNSREMYILFNKKLDLSNMNDFPAAISCTDRSASPIATFTGVRLYNISEHSTGLIFTLDTETSLDMIKNGMMQIVSNSIQDTKGNAVVIGIAHTYSDFLVGAVKPLYAYDDNSFRLLQENQYDAGKTGTEAWAMHRFDGSNDTGNTLLADSDLVMAVDCSGLGSDASGLKMYISNNPTEKSDASAYEEDTGLKCRVWIPNSTILDSIAPVSNSNAKDVTPTFNGSIAMFDINNKTDSALRYAADTEVTFLFDTGISIDHDCNAQTSDVPLFALRLANPSDVADFDMWSFFLKGIKAQRGGVTVLNNVINASKKESAVLEVVVPKTGNVTIQILTLDGNVVQTLQRGSLEGRDTPYCYRWDGSTKKGKPVARGMYFVRVAGPGIDETRKIMVVKD